MMRTTKQFLTTAMALGAAVWMGFSTLLAGVPDETALLEKGFLNPSDSAKPQTWWHWVDGRVNREAITAELEALKRIGVGGVHMFSAGGHAPSEVLCLSPEWDTLVRHALAECERLGLAFTAQQAAGWSGAGGPWITPDKAMFLVETEQKTAAGGETVTLPAPQSWPAAGATYYRDIALLAFPTPPVVASAEPVQEPVISSSCASVTNLVLLKRSSDEARPRWQHERPTVDLTVSSGASEWIQFEFPMAFVCRSVTIMGGRECIEQPEQQPEVWVSEDGKQFRKVARLSTSLCVYNCAEDDLPHAILPTKGRFFRLVWAGPEHGVTKLTLRRAAFGSRPILTAFKARVGAEGRTLVDDRDLPDEPGEAVDLQSLVDLTDKRDAAGNLTWTAPAGGPWTVVRIGYRSKTRSVAPAPKEAGGLECDKFDPAVVSDHFDHYMGRILAQAKAAGSRAVKGVLVDSWEAETQNWSPVFRDEFKKRRGYDVLPYLPAYSGFIVGNRAMTRRYLRDARQTGSDLVCNAFFGTLKKRGNKEGLELYAESCGGSGAGTMVADAVQHYLYTDIPMTEAGRPMREAVSGAHVSGKPVVAMECYTQGGGADWNTSPRNLKGAGDEFFSVGINRLVFHTYAHNPYLNRLAPGPAFWKYGMPFSRGQTWWEMGHAWISYLARSQYLLQRGIAVADVLYFYGEEPDGPPAHIFAKHAPIADTWRDLPQETGYEFDLLPAEFLVKELQVRGDRIGGAAGSAYRLLVLRDSDRMTPEAVSRIRDLVHDGAAVLGPRPCVSPGLSGYPECDAQVRAIAGELWGPCDGVQVKERAFGKGRVFCGMGVTEALKALGLLPDFTYACPKDLNQRIRYIHRRDGGADIYFLARCSGGSHPVEVECRFRVTGKQPELWHPVSGKMRDLAAFRQENGITVVPLTFEEREAFFVVFRKPMAAGQQGVTGDNAEHFHTVQTLTAQWTVSFRGWGAPESIAFAQLTPWNTHAMEAIRYYSGTAVYRTTFDWAQAIPGLVRMDLGKVGVIAEVFLNGVSCGVAWNPPYQVDISGHLKPGANTLEIRVANTWANRLIGDQQLPEEQRKTWTTHHGYTKDTSLDQFMSGLAGPVEIQVGL